MQNKKFNHLALVAALLVLAGCSNNNDDSPDPVVETPPPPAVVTPPPAVADATFTVQVTNLTNAQPLSPVAVMFHQQGYNSFIDGEAASVAIEEIAEGGDNSALLAEVQAAEQHLASGSTAGPIPPRSIGDAVTLSFPSDQLSDVRLSVVTMLVHTNDGFSGLNAVNLSDFEVGQSRRFSGPTWDSGTEANDELGINIPGPAFSGQGFNSERTDFIDRVRFHTGAITSASVESGLPTSDLGEIHRFDNATTRIVVTRTE